MIKDFDYSYIKRVGDYKCPECGYHGDDEDYIISGIKYPKIYNRRSGSTMDGSYDDWDEVHKCKRCGRDFWYVNGCF
jgi:DNA-directed RNA polymerase subunit RPC12/RpoP